MNLEDLAKKAIDEVNDSFAKEQVLAQDEPKQDRQVDLEEVEHIEEENYSKQLENESPFLVESSSEIQKSSSNHELSLSEEIFLNNLKERILVLFEGLNSLKKEDLEQRLGLTINFLEFLLANIEDRLKN